MSSRDKSRAYYLLPLLLLVAGLGWVRLTIVPVDDYPDIRVVSGVFADSFWGIFRDAVGAINFEEACIEPLFPNYFLVGGRYACDAVSSYQSALWLYFYGLIFVLLVASSLLWHLQSGANAKKRLLLSILFQTLLPSTFYYLLSPHTDSLYSLFAIISVNFLIFGGRLALHPLPIKHYTTRLPASVPSNLLIPLVFCVGGASLIYVVMPDNQVIITSLFLAMLCLLSNSCYFPPFTLILSTASRQSTLLLHQKPRLVSLIALAVFLLIFISFATSYINIEIMRIVGQLGLGPISTVAQHYSTFYLDIMGKYPIPVRLFNLLQTMILRTPSGLGVSIVTFLAFFLLLCSAFLKMLSALMHESFKPHLVKASAFALFFIALAPLVVSIFPGFSNYKYWILATPVVCYCLTYRPAAALSILLFAQIELIFNALISLA